MKKCPLCRTDYDFSAVQDFLAQIEVKQIEEDPSPAVEAYLEAERGIKTEVARIPRPTPEVVYDPVPSWNRGREPGHRTAHTAPDVYDILDNMWNDLEGNNDPVRNPRPRVGRQHRPRPYRSTSENFLCLRCDTEHPSFSAYMAHLQSSHGFAPVFLNGGDNVICLECRKILQTSIERHRRTKANTLRRIKNHYLEDHANIEISSYFGISKKNKSEV